MRCKACGMNNWELVFSHVKREVPFASKAWKHLYQCRKCKRCVLATITDLEEGFEK